MSLSYFPDSGQIYGVILGCNKDDMVDDFATIQSKLLHGKDYLAKPALYMALFIELEKWHRMIEVDDVIDDLERTISTPNKSANFAMDEVAPAGLVKKHLRVQNLKIGLTTWKSQFNLMKTAANSLGALTSPPAAGNTTATHVTGFDEYFDRLQLLYEEAVMRCDRVLEGIALRFQSVCGISLLFVSDHRGVADTMQQLNSNSAPSHEETSKWPFRTANKSSRSKR